MIIAYSFSCGFRFPIDRNPCNGRGILPPVKTGFISLGFSYPAVNGWAIFKCSQANIKTYF
jgi:hypothetical protein